jgi:hypothetical protein
MQGYISYDEALEERIRADRQVQVVLERLAVRALAAWHRLSGRVPNVHRHPDNEAGLEDILASGTESRARPGVLR